jgi:3-hydroxymyristoyl/3-hydroxydecanoyl-(acyl carrier protein) dehydratase
VILDKLEISNRLDIGFEFLFVDKFYLIPESSLDSFIDKDISLYPVGRGEFRFVESLFTRAHFLSKQIVPATLILESILQVSVLTIYKSLNLPTEVHALIISVQLDLRNKVLNGEKIQTETKILSLNRNYILVEAECKLDFKIVGRAKLKYWIPVENVRIDNIE